MKLPKTALAAAGALAVLIAAYFILSSSPGIYDALAKCLSEKGVKMYGASWCPHCNDEKHMFGSSWKYMNYVECSAPGGGQAQECAQAGIRQYPTWEWANGTREAKVFTLEQLGAASGCPLNQSQ